MFKRSRDSSTCGAVIRSGFGSLCTRGLAGQRLNSLTGWTTSSCRSSAEYCGMPHGLWLIAGGTLLLIIALFLVASASLDLILYVLAAVLIVVGVVYLLRGRGRVL